MFVACPGSDAGGRHYEYQKTLMFNEVLGPYPYDMMTSVRATHPGIFSSPGSFYPGPQVSDSVIDFLDVASPLRCVNQYSIIPSLTDFHPKVSTSKCGGNRSL